MKPWAALLLVLPAIAPAVARERPPKREYDCSASQVVPGERYQSSIADENGAGWYFTLPRGSVFAYVSLGTDAARDGFLAQGVAYPGAHPVFLFSFRGREAVSVDIRVGETTLPLRPMEGFRYGQRTATVAADPILPRLAGEGAMTVTFYNRRSDVLMRESIPLALIREGLAGLPTLLIRARENLADPSNRCMRLNEPIMI